MMKLKFVIISTVSVLLLHLVSVPSCARLTFTEKIRSKSNVVLRQSDDIDYLVNGRNSEISHSVVATVQPGDKDKHLEEKPKQHKADLNHNKAISSGKSTIVSSNANKITYTQGYRVKFFTGGSSRADRELARRKGKEFKNTFPHVSVYMHFISPHWICTAGDFATQTDAYEFIKEVKALGLFRTSEMIVVKSKIKQYNY